MTMTNPISACTRLPTELLEAIFATLFHHRDSFRQRISRMSTLAQVCKAWKPVAETTALEIVLISMQDADALAYLDPAHSPVREALGGVHILALTYQSRAAADTKFSCDTMATHKTELHAHPRPSGVEEADLEDGTETPDSDSATDEANKLTQSRFAANLL